MSACSVKNILTSYKFKILAAAFPALLATSFNAAASTTPTPAPLAPDTNWHYRIAPYIWALNMNGTTQIGTRRAHVDESFEDILNHLDFAGMIWLEADKGNFGIFLNTVFATLSDTANDGPVALNAKVRFGLYTAGVSYQAYQSDTLSLFPYAGFRYTMNHNRLNVNIPGTSVSLRDNQGWTDALIGLRALYHFNKSWSATLAGDVGGKNTSSDYSYNVIALIGWQPQTVMTNTTFYAGYHLLDQTYETGHGSGTYVWKMQLAGPILGVAFDF